MEIVLMLSFQWTLLFTLIHKISHHQYSLAIKLSLKISCLIWCQSNFEVIAAFKSPLHCGRVVLVSSSFCLLDYLCVSLQEQREDLRLLSSSAWGTGGPFFSWASLHPFFTLCSQVLLLTTQTFAGSIGQQSYAKHPQQKKKYVKSPKERSFSLS